MATSSLLGIDSDNLPPVHSATGIDSLGPSDASDSGSDSAGVYSADSDSDTDRFGTGERGSVEQDSPRRVTSCRTMWKAWAWAGPTKGPTPMTARKRI